MNTAERRHHFLSMPTEEIDWNVDFTLTGRDGHAFLLLARMSKAILWNMETGRILQEISTSYNDERVDLVSIVLFNPLKGQLVLSQGFRGMFRRQTNLQLWNKNPHGTYERRRVLEIADDKDLEEGCLFGQFVRFAGQKLIFTSLSGERPVRRRKIESRKMSSIFYSPFVVATEHDKSKIMVYDFFDVDKFRLGSESHKFCVEISDDSKIPNDFEWKNF